MIVLDADPSLHFTNMKYFSLRLGQHGFKLSPSKTTIGTTDSVFLGHTVFPAGIIPNETKAESLTKIPLPTDQKQLRLRDMAKQIRSKQGVRFPFIPALKTIVRKQLAELSTPPVIAYPRWDAVSDTSHSFLLYRGASVDGFGVNSNREQDDRTINDMVFISHATIESYCHWTPLDLEAGSIICSIKRLRVYLWGANFRNCSDHKALGSLEKRRTHPASTVADTISYRVQLHPILSQRQCQRKHRVPLPPPLAGDGARLQGPLQSSSV